MLLNISILEWLGYLSSVIVAISLTMSSIIKLRWFNLVGAAAFSFYGFMIGSLPVGFLNLFIVWILLVLKNKFVCHIISISYFYMNVQKLKKFCYNIYGEHIALRVKKT